MSVTVRIPTPLRNLTDGAETVAGDGQTVAAVLSDICARHDGLKERLFDESGAIRRFVNIYLNSEDIRFENGPDTPVNDGDEVSIIPAIAGG